MTSACSIAYEWGSSAAERALPFPCDSHLPDADAALFRAVDVAAPPAVVFRWLCQLRAAPYSYDWIDNLGRTSPRALTPGLERLAVGQRFMTLFELVAFAPGLHVTLATRSALFGTIAVSYVVHPPAAVDAAVRQGRMLPGATSDATAVPRLDDGAARTCRLVVKLLVRYPRGPLGLTLRALLPWGDLVMMRKQLRTLKELAERSARAA